MQLAFDSLYILAIIIGIVWWTRWGRRWAARHIWPQTFWASFPGWLFGLLITLTVAAWIRSALTQMFFLAHP